MSVTNLLNRIQHEDIKFVDLRFTDTLGKEHHVSVPAHNLERDWFEQGKMFDGSSISGWKSIDQSDMILQPDADACFFDVFRDEATLVVRCDVVDPKTSAGYERDPRSIAKRAEVYLQDTGIADTALFGPELEFFLFEDVRWDVKPGECFHRVDSQEAVWNSRRKYKEGNLGHRPKLKGGYFPVPPVDSSQDIRSQMCLVMEQFGLTVETHHHEVATANQNEIATACNTLVKKADEVQIYKYAVHNVAHSYQKSATFMPKPLVGDNGSGMHVHQSLFKEGKNLFAGNAYEGLSEIALHYIGGIIHHAQALNAFTNPTTNSYRRLVPGFEAPVNLAYSARNRSAAIRIPHVSGEKQVRVEVRFPDPSANPYLAFSAMLMAGLDGVKRKLQPGAAVEKDLYELSEKELKKIPCVASSLDKALDALETEHKFLLEGGVFSKEMLAAYIALKRRDVERLRLTTHPVEFDMYYSV